MLKGCIFLVLQEEYVGVYIEDAANTNNRHDILNGTILGANQRLIVAYGTPADETVFKMVNGITDNPAIYWQNSLVLPDLGGVINLSLKSFANPQESHNIDAWEWQADEAPNEFFDIQVYYQTSARVVPKALYRSEENLRIAAAQMYEKYFDLGSLTEKTEAQQKLFEAGKESDVLEEETLEEEVEAETVVFVRTRGMKVYEYSNHLGNVLVTISDKVLYEEVSGAYIAQVATAQDYYPFGSVMPGRKYEGGNGYRWGYNGQEKENEIAEGIMSAKYWFYDSRIGRRWNMDPVFKEWESSYACFGNNPIFYDDPHGDDAGNGDGKHKVKSGETLGKIAKQYNTTVEKLVDLNGIKNRHHIAIGDELKIPGASSVSSYSWGGNSVASLKCTSCNVGYTDSNGSNIPAPTPAPRTNPNTEQTKLVNNGGEELGKLSEKYETGGKGPGTVSHGRGDAGGASYGCWQMTSQTARKNLPPIIGGTVKKFVIANSEMQDFVSLTPGSSEFSLLWKQTANEDAALFRSTQYAYIKETHYMPVYDAVMKDCKVDLNHRSAALRDVVWSTTVQHGSARSIVTRSIGTPMLKGRTDEEIIQMIYEERTKSIRASKSNSQSVIDGVVERFKSEQSEALKMLKR